MGRKSLATERTQQILDAFEACIVEYGLEGATLQRIADRANVRLSMIDHYIGKRDALITAMIERFITRYQSDQADFLTYLSTTERLQALLTFYFSESGSQYRPQDATILSELMSLGQRDESLRAKLLDTHQQLENMFYVELKREYRSADDAAVRQVAYQLLSLWYGHATMRWIGYSAERHEWAHQAAQQLVATLQTN